MKKIKIKLNVTLCGNPEGSTILIDPTDSYWAIRLKENTDSNLIEILTEDPPLDVKKSQSTKSKEIKT